METTWPNPLTVSLSISCVLSVWQHCATETEDPKEPLVSSFSFWHWLLDICHHLILYYSVNSSPSPHSSLLLAPNLLWHLIMLQVLWVTSVLYSFPHCFVLFCLRYTIIFKICAERSIIQCIPCCNLCLKKEKSPALPLCCLAVLWLMSSWSGQSVDILNSWAHLSSFSCDTTERNSGPIREAIHQSGKQRRLTLAAPNTSHHIP